MAAADRVHYWFVIPEPIDLYLDSRNFISYLEPLSTFFDLRKAAVRKVLRCAVVLTVYNYLCIHISCEENVCSDIL